MVARVKPYDYDAFDWHPRLSRPDGDEANEHKWQWCISSTDEDLTYGSVELVPVSGTRNLSGRSSNRYVYRAYGPDDRLVANTRSPGEKTYPHFSNRVLAAHALRDAHEARYRRTANRQPASR